MYNSAGESIWKTCMFKLERERERERERESKREREIIIRIYIYFCQSFVRFKTCGSLLLCIVDTRRVKDSPL